MDWLCRAMAVNSRTVGAALGNIMAIIMISHMTKTRSARAGDQGTGSKMVAESPMAVISRAFMPMPAPVNKYAQAAAATVASPATTRRSRLRSDSRDDDGVIARPSCGRPLNNPDSVALGANRRLAVTAMSIIFARRRRTLPSVRHTRRPNRLGGADYLADGPLLSRVLGHLPAERGWWWSDPHQNGNA